MKFTDLLNAWYAQKQLLLTAQGTVDIQNINAYLSYLEARMDKFFRMEKTMNIKEINALEDDHLIEAMHSAASDLSYYNAAEGQDYRNEAAGRHAANEHYRALATEIKNRNLSFSTEGYLL